MLIVVSQTNSSITVRWNSVDDVEEYEVQVRADGSWEPASCGGGGARVTEEECVASGLDRGTSYSFQVRAHPDPNDETKTVSAWSSTTAAQTAGTRQEEEVTGGDDAPDISWESTGESSTGDDATITWSWDATSDRRIQYQVALLADPRNAAADSSAARPKCPALTGTPASGPFVEGTTGAWFAKEPTFAKKLTGLEDGEVFGLCVVTTWDTDTGPQYGDVGLVWATTSPALGTVPGGGVSAGQKPTRSTTTGTKTNAIDWYVALDSGFDYNVQIVSTTFDGTTDGTNLDCNDASGTVTKLTGATSKRHRLSNPSTYTTYAACVTASDGNGSSKPSQLTHYDTPPKAPTFGTITVPTYTRGNASASPAVSRGWSGDMVWHFGGEPDSSERYEIVVELATSLAESKDSSKCGAGTDLAGSASIEATGNTGNRAFKVEIASSGTSSLGLLAASDTTTDVNNYVRSCVRARLGTSADTPVAVGPWKVGRPKPQSH